jgi:NAD(P)-dependent dehydrogenase (short-subunit alcohol dehydrogenase family)
MVDQGESLAGKVVIVTGASRGIGRAVAIRLGQLGAKVVLNYCANEERAQEALQAVKDAGAADARAIRADVSKPAEAQHLVDSVLAEYQRVDILINNAGVQRSVLVHKMTDADWHEVMDINLSSIFYLSRYL